MASGSLAGLRAPLRGVRKEKPPSFALALADSQAATTGTVARSRYGALMSDRWGTVRHGYRRWLDAGQRRGVRVLAYVSIV